MKAYVLHGVEDLRSEQRSERELEPDELRIEIARVGICGSDVHYYNHYRIGDFVPQAPLVLGHEFAGEVIEIGSAEADRYCRWRNNRADGTYRRARFRRGRRDGCGFWPSSAASQSCRRRGSLYPPPYAPSSSGSSVPESVAAILSAKARSSWSSMDTTSRKRPFIHNHSLAHDVLPMDRADILQTDDMQRKSGEPFAQMLSPLGPSPRQEPAYHFYVAIPRLHARK